MAETKKPAAAKKAPAAKPNNVLSAAEKQQLSAKLKQIVDSAGKLAGTVSRINRILDEEDVRISRSAYNKLESNNSQVAKHIEDIKDCVAEIEDSLPQMGKK